jgi:hypothetical protein
MAQRLLPFANDGAELGEIDGATVDTALRTS